MTQPGEQLPLQPPPGAVPAPPSPSRAPEYHDDWRFNAGDLLFPEGDPRNHRMKPLPDVPAAPELRPGHGYTPPDASPFDPRHHMRRNLQEDLPPVPAEIVVPLETALDRIEIGLSEPAPSRLHRVARAVGRFIKVDTAYAPAPEPEPLEETRHFLHGLGEEHMKLFESFKDPRAEFVAELHDVVLAVRRESRAHSKGHPKMTAHDVAHGIRSAANSILGNPELARNRLPILSSLVLDRIRVSAKLPSPNALADLAPAIMHALEVALPNDTDHREPEFRRELERHAVSSGAPETLHNMINDQLPSLLLGLRDLLPASKNDVRATFDQARRHAGLPPVGTP